MAHKVQINLNVYSSSLHQVAICPLYSLNADKETLQNIFKQSWIINSIQGLIDAISPATKVQLINKILYSSRSFTFPLYLYIHGCIHPLLSPRSYLSNIQITISNHTSFLQTVIWVHCVYRHEEYPPWQITRQNNELGRPHL